MPENEFNEPTNEENDMAAEGEQVPTDPELAAEGIDEAKLPFPTATIVRQMRKHIQGKMISSKVKVAMNEFLGEIVESVSQEMGKTRYSMVEMDDFLRATKPFTYAKELQHEKERVVFELERMRSDLEALIREFQRKFALIKADDFSVLTK